MTIKEIDQVLEVGDSLKQIAQAYSEIANLKIKRIRADVERNTYFFAEISKVYALVKKLAIKRGVYMKKPKKTISVVLTSNYRFYGSINSDLLQFFVNYTRNIDTDRVIVGKEGINYFKASKIFTSYQQVILKADQPDAAELDNLVKIIKEYNQVLIFYSNLKSLLVQVPQVVDITASQPEESEEDKKLFVRFIFEPQLPKVLAFFDSQILTLLLESTFLESELSRTASRFISMDQAETEANKFIKQYQKIKAYAKRNLDNNKILENFASMMAVRRII